MKKLSFLFFVLSSLWMAWIVRDGAVQTDIFALINPQSSLYKDIIQITQQKIARNVAFLSTDHQWLESLESLERGNFESFSLRQDLDFKLLEGLKIASLNEQTYLQLTKNPAQFFNDRAQSFVNPFLLRLDSKDLLNFGGDSSFLGQNHFQFDWELGMIFTEFQGRKYYLAHARLAQNYDSKSFLEGLEQIERIENLKNQQGGHEEFLAMGNEIFASVAKLQGHKESVIFGGISVLCITLLMYCAFRSWQILKLLLVVLYSFLCGITAGFLIFGEIHLLSIVASMSLIGLVLDFSMHWLGDAIGRKIVPKDALKLSKVFFSGFVITSGGYGFFLFSGMEFLRQIAVISIFGLLGSLLVTLFLLPFLFENVQLSPHKRLMDAIDRSLVFYQKFALIQRRVFLICCVVIVAVLLVFIPQQNFNDEVKKYSTIPQDLLVETKRFLTITKSNPQTNFLILKSNHQDLIDKERKLISALKEKHLIEDYEGVSKFFLSQNEQNHLKEVLQTHKSALIEAFGKLGFKEDFVVRYLEEICAIPTLSVEEIMAQLQFLKNHPMETFFVNADTSILFLQKPLVNAEFREILESFDAHFIDQSAEISQYFTEAKEHAIFLKFCAFIFAFVVLCALFGFKDSIEMLTILLLSSFLSLAILLVCHVELNIFSIFGLILASSIGVDYVIFATNAQIPRQKRVFGVVLASLTSLISFAMLGLSQTYAVFSFGVSVSLCLSLCAFFALSLVNQC